MHQEELSMSMLTMKTIMQTFSEMIEEMPFDKITVLALVKRCEINHNTFYYHFQDLYELLDKWIQYEIDKLVKTLEDPTDLKAEMKAVFQACKEYPKIINHILSSLSKEQLEYHFFIKTEDSISKYIKKQLEDAGKYLSDEQIQSTAEFCRFALAGYFLKFNYMQPKPDVDEYVNHFEWIFDDLVHWTLESRE
ncbi:TetR family transcriptional regulator [Dorea sp. AM58-8]|jgi:AcrR family transcriptional regulator|nr:TetR family transcriptional regulator [Dorea sp. AM58-8]